MKAIKMTLPILFVTLLAGSVFSAQSAHAYGCPYLDSKDKQVTVTNEQRNAARALVEEAQKKIRPLRDQLFVKDQELIALQNAANPDVVAVGKVATEIVNLRQALFQERVNLGLALDKALGLEPGTHKLTRHGMGRGDGHTMGRGEKGGHGEKGGRGHGEGRGHGMHCYDAH